MLEGGKQTHPIFSYNLDLRKGISMKKVFSIIFAILILTTTALPAFAANNSSEVQPYYNNTITTSAAFRISSTGYATASYSYSAYDNYFTSATVVTKIQKRTLGLFWKTVDINQPNNTWVDTWTSVDKNYSHSYQLTDSGTYRAVVEFTINGTNGPADEITKETSTVTFS